MTTERIEYGVICDRTSSGLGKLLVTQSRNLAHVVAVAEGECHPFGGHGTQEIVWRSVITTDWKPVKP